MKAVTVCVEYGDLLAITLKRNARHFEKIVVVTTPTDYETHSIVCSVEHAQLVKTDVFYSDGAAFRKWAALELGLDVLGRDGWITVLDADVLLPETVDYGELDTNCLYSAWRRMLYEPSEFHDGLDWNALPIARDRELAGYHHVFHASAPVSRPWYGDWKHAGGGDSEFVRKWRRKHQKRLPFEVLHLGPDGKNWCGRTTARLDGTMPSKAAERTEQLEDFLERRHWEGNSHERYEVDD